MPGFNVADLVECGPKSTDPSSTLTMEPKSWSRSMFSPSTLLQKNSTTQDQPHKGEHNLTDFWNPTFSHPFDWPPSPLRSANSLRMDNQQSNGKAHLNDYFSPQKPPTSRLDLSGSIATDEDSSNLWYGIAYQPVALQHLFCMMPELIERFLLNRTMEEGTAETTPTAVKDDVRTIAALLESKSSRRSMEIPMTHEPPTPLSSLVSLSAPPFANSRTSHPIAPALGVGGGGGSGASVPMTPNHRTTSQPIWSPTNGVIDTNGWLEAKAPNNSLAAEMQRKGFLDSKAAAYCNYLASHSSTTGGHLYFPSELRKPKRIRTAFSPQQLFQLETTFERNHYVVGQERKDLAATLGLTETQVKVWFQNRRTKFKRIRLEEKDNDEEEDADEEPMEGESPAEVDSGSISSPIGSATRSEEDMCQDDFHNGGSMKGRSSIAPTKNGSPPMRSKDRENPPYASMCSFAESSNLLFQHSKRQQGLENGQNNSQQMGKNVFIPTDLSRCYFPDVGASNFGK